MDVYPWWAEEQKGRFLRRISKGTKEDIGAIVITEPFAVTDAAAMEMSARREGEGYILKMVP